MTPTSAEDMAGRLYGLLIWPKTAWDPSRREVHHYIEVDEYGLALEAIAGLLGYLRAAITAEERGDMLARARRMKIDDFVSRALESCPHATGRPGLSLPPDELPSLLSEPDSGAADKHSNLSTQHRPHTTAADL